MGAECTEILHCKDRFVSGELSPDERHTVTEHLRTCEACAAEFEQVEKLRARLKTAVAAQGLPIGLETRIRARLGEPDRKTLQLPLPKIAFAALAVVLLTVTTWSLAVRPMHAQIAAMLGIGAGDHIHCTLERQNPPLGTLFRDTEKSFPGVLAALRENMPKEFRLIESHFCHHNGREFGHFVYEKEGHKVSVIAALKSGQEHFPRTAILARLRAHGVPVYHDAITARSLQASGFETARHFVFVVSDLRENENLAIMAALGPVLTEVVR